MKKLYTMVIAAVAALTMTGCQQAAPTAEVARPVLSDSISLPIAYVNIDSLLFSYEFAKEMNEAFVRKAEDARANLNGQLQKFERDANEFQRKLQTNAFLSEDRARQEADRLQKRQGELEQLQNKLQSELAQQQAEMNKRLSDTVRAYLKEYNAVKKYELIFSNTTLYDNILLDFPKYDITAEVLQGLNERYARTKAAK